MKLQDFFSDEFERKHLLWNKGNECIQYSVNNSIKNAMGASQPKECMSLVFHWYNVFSISLVQKEYLTGTETLILLGTKSCVK